MYLKARELFGMAKLIFSSDIVKNEIIFKLISNVFI